MDALTSGDLIVKAGSLISGNETSMPAMIACVVIGVLFCFLGLKITRLLTAVAGFALGAAIGYVVGSTIAQLMGLTLVIAIFGGAIVMALLAFFIRRLGVFLVTLGAFFSVIISMFDSADNRLYVLIALAIALVLAILASIFMEPMIIVVTSVWGGFLAGGSIASMAGLADDKYRWAIGGVMAIIGMIVQFVVTSRKVSKKDKKHREEVKNKKSREVDVEKAKNLLDDDLSDDNILDFEQDEQE